MNGDRLPEVHEALVNAFDDAGLERLVQFHLNTDLDAITSHTSRSGRVLELVQWAKAQGMLDRLLIGALAENPGNEAIRHLFSPLSDENPTRLQTAALAASMYSRQSTELAAIRQDLEYLKNRPQRAARAGYYIAGLVLMDTGILIQADVIRYSLSLTYTTAIIGTLFLWVVSAYLLLFSRGSVD